MLLSGNFSSLWEWKFKYLISDINFQFNAPPREVQIKIYHESVIDYHLDFTQVVLHTRRRVKLQVWPLQVHWLHWAILEGRQ